MDSNTIYTKTTRGKRALIKKLPKNAGLVLPEIDGGTNLETILANQEKLQADDVEEAINWLLEGGFIKLVVQDPFSDSVWDEALSHNAVEVDEIALDQFTVTDKSARAKKQVKPLSDEEMVKLKELEQADQEAKERAEAALKAKLDSENVGKAAAETVAAAEEHAKKAAEEKRKAEEAEQAKREAEAKAAEEAERKAAELEAKAIAKAEENARKEAEAKKKAEEKAAEEKRKAEEAEQAKREAEAKAAEEAERKAAELEAKAIAKAEENARKEAEAKKKAEEKAAEEKRKAEEAEQAKREAEAKAAEEAERKAAELEAKAIAKAEEKAKKEAEAKKKAEERAEAKEKARLEAAVRKEEKARIKEEKRAEAEKIKAEKAEAKTIAKQEAAAKKAAKKAAADTHRTKRKQAVAEDPFTADEVEQYLADGEERSLKKKPQHFSSIKRWLTTILKSIKPLSIYAVAVLFLLIFAVQFINFHIWAGPIERIAKQNIQDDVNVKSVHVSFFPSPHLTLGELTIANSTSITAETVRVYPNLTKLKDKLLNKSSAPYEVESIEVDGFKIAQKYLSRVASWKGASSRDQQLKVNKVSFKNMSIQLNKLELPNMDADIIFDKAGLIKQATLFTESKNLIATIKHTNNNYLVDLEAIRWRAPIAPYPIFTKLNAKASIQNQVLSFSNITGTLYNGSLSAKADINLASEALTTNGSYQLRNFFIADMAEELKLNNVIEGKLASDGEFSFNVNTALNSAENTKLKATYNIKDGYLKTVDLPSAMRTGNLSGETKFTSLSGHVSLNNKAYQFNQLLLRHGQLTARGKLSLSPENYVNGVISSSIAVKRRPINARLNIFGPLSALRIK